MPRESSPPATRYRVIKDPGLTDLVFGCMNQKGQVFGAKGSDFRLQEPGEGSGFPFQGSASRAQGFGFRG